MEYDIEMLRTIVSGTTLEELIDCIREWSYYDNMQHGRYFDENAAGYGPIAVYNGTIHMWVNGRYIDRWGREGREDPPLHRQMTIADTKECAEPLFHGDISLRRIAAMALMVTEADKLGMYEVRVRIDCERGFSARDTRVAIDMKSGEVTCLMVIEELLREKFPGLIERVINKKKDV